MSKGIERKPRVVGFGSVTWDFCALVREKPQLERTVFADTFVEAPGGQMGNTLRFLSRFGVNCQFRGHVGDDEYGRRIADSLVADGIDIEHLALHAGEESRLVVTFTLGGSGDRGFIYRPDQLGNLEFPTASLTSTDVILLGECDDRTLEVTNAVEAQRIPCWFLGGWTRHDPEQLLSHCEGVVVSREFVSSWLPERSLGSSLEALIELGPKIAVITDGREGGLAWIGGARYRFGSYRVHALDTAGAGDAFAAGILFSALCGHSANQMLRFASACAAVNIQALTASAAPRSLEEVEMFLTAEPNVPSVSEVKPA